MTVHFACPVCHDALIGQPSGFACRNGHRYDRAREGYVNLLPGGRLKGPPSGDSDAMVRARRTVFDAGLYSPIIDAVATTVAASLSTGVHETRAVLDCGCGEGAYLGAAVAASGAEGWGIDISKPAAKLAARRHPALHIAVASSYALPFDDGVFDAALSVFAPRPIGEMMRVLRPGGVAVVVTPGPDHLIELKEVVYDAPRQHRDPLEGELERWPAEPELVSAVRFEVRLEQPAVRRALLEMTPFWWSASTQSRAEIAETVHRVTIDMRLVVHRRDSSG